MERATVIAIILGFVMLIAYDLFLIYDLIKSYSSVPLGQTFLTAFVVLTYSSAVAFFLYEMFRNVFRTD